MTLPFIPSISLAPYEICFIRLFFALVVWRRLPQKIIFAAQPCPAGLARLVDLRFLANPVLYHRLRSVACMCLVCYVTGFFLSFVTVYLFVLVTAYGSLRNSQGASDHTKQVLALILLVQATVYVFRDCNHVFNPGFQFAGGAGYDQIAVFWSQQAIIAVYFTSALTKLKRSRGLWVWKCAYIAIQLLKTSEQQYHSSHDAKHLENAGALARKAVRYPNLTRLALSLGLFLEFFSPLMLYSRKTIVAGGVLLFIFHHVNARYMRLTFNDLKWCVVIFLVNVPYLINAFLIHPFRS